MKNKTLLLILGGLFVAATAWASIVYSQNLVSEAALAVNKNFPLDLKTAGRGGATIKQVAATATYSNAAPAATTFTDGGVASGTFTVTSITGLVGVKASQTITVTSTSSLRNAILVVRGSGSTTQLREGYNWNVGTGTATTAANIARILDKVAGIDASSAGNIIYATATVAGTAGNAFTLSKISAANLTLGGATFSGGVDDAYVDIAGQRLTRGTQWAVGASTVATAGNIATAIRANTTLNAAITVSTSASAVVTLTYKTVGTAGNVALATFPSSITKSGTALVNGTDSAYSLSGTTIHKVAHGLSTGLAALYSTGGFTLSGLTNQTTYYAYRVDADNYKLSTSTTNAVAGTGIVLASTSTAGPHTWTLTPLAMAGTFGFQWQTSDDNVTWTNVPLSVSISSVSFATPFTAGSASWNFGAVGHRYLRVAETQGTSGGMVLTVSVTGRND